MQTLTISKFLTALALQLAILGSLSPARKQAQATHENFSTMNGALEAIQSKYQVRIGLEYATDDPDRLPVSVNLSGPLPTTALDSVLTQKSAYAWKLQDGVYDIYPKSAEDSLLDVTIQRFSTTNATPQQVSSTIGELPEVKAWLAKHHARRNELETGPRWKASDQPVSLKMTEVSLRSILNHIIVQTGRTNWLVVRYGDKAEFIAIYI